MYILRILICHKQDKLTRHMYDIPNTRCYRKQRYSTFETFSKLEKKYAPALDNFGQSCFVRSDFLKMKCVCKTQMMPPPDHQNPVDMYTSFMCINILQNIKAVAPKL